MPVLNPETGDSNKTAQARVLIVEDEFLIAMELEYRLLEAGIEVVGTAITAEEAIAIAKSEKPDLAIMDIRLAGRRDGVDAAIELFSLYGIRSVFASAHADSGTRKRAAAASPIGWLQKPYPAEELIQLLCGHFQNCDGDASARSC